MKEKRKKKTEAPLLEFRFYYISHRVDLLHVIEYVYIFLKMRNEIVKKLIGFECIPQMYLWLAHTKLKPMPLYVLKCFIIFHIFHVSLSVPHLTSVDLPFYIQPLTSTKYNKMRLQHENIFIQHAPILIGSMFFDKAKYKQQDDDKNVYSTKMKMKMS